MMNDVAITVIYDGTLVLLIEFKKVFMFHLSARNDVGIILQGPIDERNSKFLIPNFQSLICLQLINFNNTVSYWTLPFLLLTWELQSISGLMQRADYIFVEFFHPKVLSLISVAQAKP